LSTRNQFDLPTGISVSVSIPKIFIFVRLLSTAGSNSQAAKQFVFFALAHQKHSVFKIEEKVWPDCKTVM